MDKKLLEKIEQAKKAAKEDYEQAMKKINCYNPHYERAWRKVKGTKGKTIFALEGTPDKAFVVVEKNNFVTARRQDFSIIKTFE